jgi:hypothetical protein
MVPLGERMVAGLEDPDDPLLRQEQYRQLFSGMSAAYIGLFLGDTRYPDFWPIANMAYNFLSPNPDDAYYMAALDGNGSYRISGYRGTVHMVDFSITSGDFFPKGTGSLGPVVDHYDLDTVKLAKDGSFDVLLSAQRPAGYHGGVDLRDRTSRALPLLEYRAYIVADEFAGLYEPADQHQRPHRAAG